MARAEKLKVFRTPIGFHDAFVAAPSQKAALEAWGADSNLFASGSAERIEDPELMREPLASPGQVIRRLRGTLAEHVAALPKMPAAASRSRRKKTSQPDDAGGAAARQPPSKPKPRPSRVALDRAEAALDDLEKAHSEATTELARRMAELDRERRALEAKQARQRDKLLKRVEATRDKYDREMRTWRAS